MQTRPSFLFCVCALALFVSACSSTTVVAETQRQAAPELDIDPVDGADVSVEDGASDSQATDSAETDGALSPSQLEEEDSFGLGGSDQLRSLMRDCAADNDMACDILYQISAFDSPEEDMAVTCAGRSETTVFFCTQGIEQVSGEFAFDPASPALPGIVEACEQGDFTACDFLYFRSPIGSEFEEIGNTCAGRTQVAVPDCRTAFADES